MTTSSKVEKLPHDRISVGILVALAVYVSAMGVYFTFFYHPQPPETALANLASAMQEAIAKGQCTIQVSGADTKTK